MSKHTQSRLPFSQEASAILGEALYGYMIGQARDNASGADLNEQAFSRYSLVPRVMTGQSATDISVPFFGRRLSAPLVAGAFAGDRVFHADGLLPIARACRSLDLPLVISEETVTPLADICAEHDMCWLQLRAAGPLDRISRLVDRAAEAGAMGIVLTVLAPVHPVAGLQPGGYSIGDELVRRGWATIGSTKPGVESLPAFPAWSWNEIAAVAKRAAIFGLPLMVKGVLRPEDAMLAKAAGCAAVVASNIGTRQSARWVPALRQLDAIRRTEPGFLLHDGGVRYGADVVTALALGASLAIVTRPLICALVAGGETAVRDVLLRLADETLALASWCGVAKVSDLDASFLSQATSGDTQ